MGVGYVEGVTHDYRRHGTTTLFAALNIETGTAISQCRRRHRHIEYLDFLRQIDKAVPPRLDVHIIVDNYSTHKHARIKRWMAARPRFPRAPHGDLQLLVKPGGDLVQSDHPASHSARDLQQRQATHQPD